MKGRALRRALASQDALRVGADVPLITDTTELVTPALAQELLRRNTHNRPINWNKVEEYADTMRRGEWELTPQGIIIDTADNIQTGQKRLWAVIYSDCNIYMRISRGNLPRIARLLDRGTPQTARDLATRDTGRKHSPVEASIARAYCVLMGNPKPSVDVLADCIHANAEIVSAALHETARSKKTRTMLMVLGALCFVVTSPDQARHVAASADAMATDLDAALAPHEAGACWNKGTAFGLAMLHAQRIVERRLHAR